MAQVAFIWRGKQLVTGSELNSGGKIFIKKKKKNEKINKQNKS